MSGVVVERAAAEPLGTTAPVYAVVDARHDGFLLDALDRNGRWVADPRILDLLELTALVEEWGSSGTRFVWDTPAVYPALLTRGGWVARAHDVRLTRGLLRRAGATAGAYEAVPTDEWDAPAADSADDALFAVPRGGTCALVDEFQRQLAALAPPDAAPLRILVAAESAGALAAAEMRHTGLPWSRQEHERILEAALGPRPPGAARPDRLEALAARIRTALDTPELNPDSPQELLRALRRAGLRVESTRSFALRRLDHEVVGPLLEYKKLARLHTANGWAWLDAWVHQGRFRPDYVVGGVVTGRWATRGGGAMQLPKQIRDAVVADPGCRLIVADAAQLEPRVLAGMAHDLAMADAGRGRDLYDGIVAGGAAPDRPAAKIGVLAALYGATQGAAGRLVPRLAAWFPRALRLVEAAARAGERGGQVDTLLGRRSPAPAAPWVALQADATAGGASDDLLRRARSAAREQGRFTRNFVVQGTAAEWALCWMADLRLRLHALGDGPLAERPHLAYFLHDEVLVHTPVHLAEATADAVRAAAAAAGRLLFGDFPVDFPLDVAVVERYGDA